MTLLWFFIWLIWDLVGDEEPLTFNPVTGGPGASCSSSHSTSAPYMRSRTRAALKGVEEPRRALRLAAR